MTEGKAPVLLIGGSGMLGRAWKQVLDERQIPCLAPSHSELDIADEGQVKAAVDGGVSFVVNCAAWTDVDGAETHEAQAAALNGDATGVLARTCARADVGLIHYSTDYVFNGHATSPYPVDAPIEPINAYGRTKALGEQAILDAGGPHMIVRTSWLYAPWGKNFVLTMAKLLAEKDQLNVVNDQRGRPTSSQHLASHTFSLFVQDWPENAGVWHITDGGECTWYEFASEIARLTGSTCKVNPCTTQAFPRPAKRPAYSVLDLSKTEAKLGSLPDWKANLRAVLDEAGLLKS